jgi:phage terminase large subunit
MLDNPFISQNSKEQILSYEPTETNIESGTADRRKWEIYGLGKRAAIEGLIFPEFGYCTEIPEWVSKRYYGVDYGFSSDPTAIVEVGIYDNTLYIDELCYRTNMLTADIINFLKELPRRRVISESADPRMIQEISNAGIDIISVIKYGGSVNAGIDKMQSMKIIITERSLNLKKEFQNYTWRFDEKTSRFLNEPVDDQNHCIDSIRYVVLEMLLGRNKTKLNTMQSWHKKN